MYNSVFKLDVLLVSQLKLAIVPRKIKNKNEVNVVDRFISNSS